jgi:hypothetical protein
MVRSPANVSWAVPIYYYHSIASGEYHSVRSLTVLVLLAILLSVLRYTDYDCPFAIFKLLFFQSQTLIGPWIDYRLKWPKELELWVTSLSDTPRLQYYDSSIWGQLKTHLRWIGPLHYQKWRQSRALSRSMFYACATGSGSISALMWPFDRMRVTWPWPEVCSAHARLFP